AAVFGHTRQHLVLLLAGARSLDDQGDAHGFQHGGDIGGGVLRGTVAAILVSAHQVDEEQVGAELLHGQAGGLRGTAQHAFPYLADRLHPANRVHVGNLQRQKGAMRERGFEGVQRQPVAAAHGERPAAARSQRHLAKRAGPFLRFQFQTHAWGSFGLATKKPKQSLPTPGGTPVAALTAQPSRDREGALLSCPYTISAISSAGCCTAAKYSMSGSSSVHTVSSAIFSKKPGLPSSSQRSRSLSP